jgi:hypothetical protein
LQISEKDFLNYIKCPLYYKLEAHGQNLQKDTFNTFLHEVATSYLNRLSNVEHLGPFNHEKYVKKMWDKICLNNQHIILPKQCIQGWGYLYRMIEYFNKPNVKLLDTSITYVISPDGSKHSLTGTLDPIIKQDDFYTTFIISFSDKLPESYVIDLNIKHTIDAYALNEFIPNVQHTITYHSFRSGSEKDTLRSGASFKRLDSVIDTIGKCIEQDLIYPRNSYGCSSCQLRGICDGWIGGTIHRNGGGQFDTEI